MCGIFGIVAVRGAAPSLDDRSVERLRDLLAHRGPDGAGLWRRDNAVLAHRRLAVLDLSDKGDQPMVSADGSIVLVYNGELYNDAEVRRVILKEDRRPFASTCDTETILRALELWGDAALPKLRGMFALAWFDRREQTLSLARDPMGVKPIYYALRQQEVIFASEPKAILAHPDVTPAPNLAMASAYLTTIRTVIGADTLFEGVLAVEPGQMVRFDLTGSAPVERLTTFWNSPPVDADANCSFDQVRQMIEDSVAAHLRSDVPVCALLSGGLDSTITTHAARQHIASLQTYCAGASSGADDDDLACARRVAHELGVEHSEAIVTREMFHQRWPEMVGELGTPLSTPNEVAINAVARRLRADGCVVTISGEGADEMFAGYETPMLSAWRFSRMPGAAGAGGRFQLESGAWIAPRAKTALLQPEFFAAASHDQPLMSLYEDLFSACVEEAGAQADPVEPHLRFLQRVNLVGLLQRLDTATMLEGVEGRTPFADVFVAQGAGALPMAMKFDPGELGEMSELESPDLQTGGPAVAVSAKLQTKIALRRAFAGRIPAEAVNRPKASFPLPFQEWVIDQAPALRASTFARAVFTNDAIEMVAADPARHWRYAWPMMNLALWGDHWWG